MDDENEEEGTGLIDRALSFLKGKAAASTIDDQFKKRKFNPNAQPDTDKTKSFEESFKRRR